MGTKDAILDRAVPLLKQGTWIPYTGPAGGTGWVNPQTGEVRYQEEPPGEVHPDYEEPSREQYVPEDVEDISEGTEVLVTDAGFVDEDGLPAGEGEYSGEGEVVDTFTDGYFVETPEGDLVSVGFEDVYDDVEEPPPGGWAEGWTEAPEDHVDVEVGQTVELYDLDAGEYVQGEVQHVDVDDPDLGNYVAIDGEDGHVYEITDLDIAGADDAVLTAVGETEVEREFGEGFEAVEFMEWEELVDSMNDQVVVDHPVFGEVEGDIVGRQETDDGEWLYLLTGEHEEPVGVNNVPGHPLSEFEVLAHREDPGPTVEGVDEWHEFPEDRDAVRFGDTLWYDSGIGPQTGTITDVHEPKTDDETLRVEVDGETSVPENQIRGIGDTGEVPLPEADISDVVEGEWVTFARESPYSEEFQHVEGVVTDADYHGVNVMTEDGESVYLEDNDNYSIYEHDERPDLAERGWLVADGTEFEPDELASEIGGDIDWERTEGDGRLSKAYLKAVQRDLRGKLMQYYGPTEVSDFYDGIESHKASGSGPSAGTVDKAFARAMDMVAEPRSGGSPSPEMVHMAKVMARLSKDHFETVYHGNARLYRGVSEKVFEDVMERYLEDPRANEFDLDVLATSKWTPDRSTAGSFGGGTLVLSEYMTTDDVVCMPDHLFNVDAGHESENEIWPHGDGRKVLAEDIEFKGSAALFGRDPTEWGHHELNEFLNWADHAYATNGRFSESEAQMETWLAVREATLQEGLEPEYRSLVEHIEERARDLGLDVPAPRPEEPPEFLTAPEYFVEGMELQAYNEMTQSVEGVDVIEVGEDSITVENAMGEIYAIGPEDVAQVDWSPEPYGPLGAVDNTDVTHDDLTDGDRVMVWRGDWYDGVVMDPPPDGPYDEVKVSVDGKNDWFSMGEVQDENRVVPWEKVQQARDDAALGGISETLDDLTPSDGDIEGPDDVEPGDWVVAPSAGYDEPIMVDEMNEDPEYGVTGVRLTNGDVLDFTQIGHPSLEGAGVVHPNLDGIVEGAVVDHPEWTSPVEVVEVGHDTVVVEDSGGHDYTLPETDTTVTDYDWSEHLVDTGPEASGGSDVPSDAADWVQDLGIAPGDTVTIDASKLPVDYDGTVEAEVVDLKNGEPRVHYSDLPWTDPDDYEENGGTMVDEILIGEQSSEAVSVGDDETGGSDEGEDYEFVAGDPVDPGAFGVGESIPIKAPNGGTAEYVVMDVPEDDDGPVELEEQPGGTRFLYWPDGEMEEL